MSATLIRNLQTAATKKDRGPARVVRAADVQELQSLGKGGHPPSGRAVTVEREVQMTVMTAAAEEAATMAPAPTLHPQAVHDIRDVAIGKDQETAWGFPTAELPPPLIAS